MISWFHLDGTECVAGWHGEGPELGQCTRGGGPVTPCPPDGPVHVGLVHTPYLRALLADLDRAHA